MSLALFLSLILQSPPASAAFQKTDPAVVKAFLKGQAVEANLFAMEKDPELQRASLGEKGPWSGDYLNAHTGYAANPYEESGSRYPLGMFKSNFSHWKNTRFPSLLTRLPHLTEEEISHLSPAEKYDLLIGTFGQVDSLAARLWMQAFEASSEDGNGDPDAKKKLELWTGFCHGYAPVSTILPRPRATLMLLSVPYTFNGVTTRFPIPFFPDDLKAIATVAHANSYTAKTKSKPEEWKTPGVVPIYFDRCNQGKKPERDSRGRMKDPRCLDTEPGFWHLAATHLLGKRKRAFIIDYDYNDAVNNHPVAGFSVTYFNPISGEEGSLKKSLVDRRGALSRDIFAAERSPESKWIVGVKMVIQRVGFTSATSALRNEVTDDKLSDRTFIYDLELDANGTILGGEWRTAPKSKLKPILGIRKRRTYPDFIWWVPEDVKPYAFVETGNDKIPDPVENPWDIHQPIPDALAEMARTAVKNNVLWSVDGKPEGDLDIHPQIPLQLIEPLMKASHQR